MKNKKYIVFETYCFGKNYYNSAFQCVPDYNIINEIPTLNYNEMCVLLERKPYLQVEIAK